jgi:hypothetical protein
MGAALLTALSIALLYVGLCEMTSPGQALAIALAYAFGTSAWTISSQAMWQHAATQLALAGLSWSLLSPASRRNTLAAGATAAFAVLARPTMLIFALVALAYVWRNRRPYLWSFLAVPIAGAAFLSWYNFSTFGATQGGYADATLTIPSLQAAAGLLVSPNRGLLIFTPAAVLAVPGIFIHRYQRPSWLAYLAIGVASSMLLYASFPFWWAGACYGPRYLSDVLPALAVLAVPTVQRVRGSRLGAVLLMALAAWGVIVQAIGVYCDDGSWNSLPTEITATRAWDWHDTHIRRAMGAGWHGGDLGPLLWQALVDPHPTLLQRLSAHDLAGTLSIHTAAPLHYRLADSAFIDVSITNLGATSWPAFSDFAFMDCGVLQRWWANGAVVPDIGGALPLPRNVGPGETVALHRRIELPTQPGDYELELLLVQRLSVNTAASGGVGQRAPVRVE